MGFLEILCSQEPTAPEEWAKTKIYKFVCFGLLTDEQIWTLCANFTVQDQKKFIF